MNHGARPELGIHAEPAREEEFRDPSPHRRVSEILALGDFVDAALRRGPGVGECEDGVGALEGTVQVLRVVQVTLNSDQTWSVSALGTE